MATILLQTTITANPDDWDVSRFSMLAAEASRGWARCAGPQSGRSSSRRIRVLCNLDELGFDQLWLMAVDVGNGLTPDECAAIGRFRGLGGAVLTARDHQNLGSCLRGLGSLGQVNEFHDASLDPASRLRRPGQSRTSRGPTTTRAPTATISRCWPSSRCTSCCAPPGPPAAASSGSRPTPTRGSVSAHVPFATVVARGRSTATGRAVQPRGGTRR